MHDGTVFEEGKYQGRRKASGSKKATSTTTTTTTTNRRVSSAEEEYEDEFGVESDEEGVVGTPAVNPKAWESKALKCSFKMAASKKGPRVEYER